ncbi:hypothetical protein AN476_20025 [Phaeobacter sp. 11ANDIMAR09]|nr:hypothetical protein AN476_20025 [Phaeobacter sp. 11ANDIMAR09]
MGNGSSAQIVTFANFSHFFKADLQTGLSNRLNEAVSSTKRKFQTKGLSRADFRRDVGGVNRTLRFMLIAFVLGRSLEDLNQAARPKGHT